MVPLWVFRIFKLNVMCQKYQIALVIFEIICNKCDFNIN